MCRLLVLNGSGGEVLGLVLGERVDVGLGLTFGSVLEVKGEVLRVSLDAY